MFTWKNHTFRGLRSKANSRRSKNHNFSNHFTEIQLERAAEGPNPLKCTQKRLPGTPKSSPECLQSLSKCLPGHQKAPPSTTTETNKSPKCSRTAPKVKIVLWPAIQADFWTPRDTPHYTLEPVGTTRYQKASQNQKKLPRVPPVKPKSFPKHLPGDQQLPRELLNDPRSENRALACNPSRFLDSPEHQKVPQSASKASQSASRGTKNLPKVTPRRPTSLPNVPERPPK